MTDWEWHRVAPGHYIRETTNQEIVKIRSRWMLSDFANPETIHRTLRAAKEAADNR